MHLITNRTALTFALGMFTAGAIGVGLGLTAANARPLHAAPDRTSYAIGHDLGTATMERLRIDGVTADQDSLVLGFEDAIRANQPAFDQTAMTAALMVVEREVSGRLAEQRLQSDPVFKALADENARKSAEFVRRFSEYENAQTLPGGIFYRVRASGSGQSPKPEDTVRLRFEARLLDGSLIGSTEPTTARIDGMIEGARTVLTRMRPGDRWMVVIPPEQAFGVGGRLPDIGPNQAIIAEVTLEGVE